MQVLHGCGKVCAGVRLACVRGPGPRSGLLPGHELPGWPAVMLASEPCRCLWCSGGRHAGAGPAGIVQTRSRHAAGIMPRLEHAKHMHTCRPGFTCILLPTSSSACFTMQEARHIFLSIHLPVHSHCGNKLAIACPAIGSAQHLPPSETTCHCFKVHSCKVILQMTMPQKR